MKNYIEAETAYPVCPKCEMELEDVEMNDYEIDDIWVYCYYLGTCPHCKRDFKWTEQHKWDERFYDFEEVSGG